MSYSPNSQTLPTCRSYFMSNQKSILITGAGGLIGSALCKTFLSAGWRVVGQVNHS
ncbi:MAG: NAD(P)-dependent oxidoreductase, partial [Actinobacteria bacterium]|nr:NAD(P)-dependent oxidoreductase [Actinomycetota bacterium]